MRRLGGSRLGPLCVLALACGCGVELEHGLDEHQANQIAALLESNGVAADKLRDEGSEAWKISVPRSELARSFQLLEDADLPRAPRRGLGETLADHGLLPSLGEEQARLEVARAAELERTLEGVPGVISARVHLALPDPARFDGAQPPARASVLLRSDRRMTMKVDEVRALLAGAISGLAEREVAVVLTGTSPASGESAVEPVGPLQVSRGQKGRVVAIAASGLALLVALGAALLVTALRLSSLRGRREETAHSAASNRSG